MATASDAGDAVRDEPRRHRRVADQRVDAVGQHVLAVHAEAEARDRDAELRGRDVAVLAAAGRRRTRCTARASRSPRAARASIAARGAPTMANSAATKMPLSSISTVMMTNAIMRPAPAPAPRVPTITDAMLPALDDSRSRPPRRRPSTRSPGSGMRPSAVATCDRRPFRRGRLATRRPPARLIQRHRAGQAHPAVGQEERHAAAAP